MLLLAGCAQIEVEANPTKVPTVYELLWESAEESSYSVLFESEGESYQTEADASGTTHRHLLWGPSEGAEVEWQVLDQSGEPQAKGHYTLPNHPASLPSLNSVGEAGFEDWLVSSVLGSVTAAIVIDSKGRYRWWYIDPSVYFPSRAIYDASKQRFLYMLMQQTTISEEGTIVSISLDGITREEITLPGIHHELILLPDGTMATLQQLPGVIEGEDVLGDAIIEVAPDGSYTTIWDIYTGLPDAGLDENVSGSPINWSHANALDYDTEEDCYYLSLRNFNSILKIDRSSGEVHWIFGGNLSTFTIEGDPGPEQSHQFELNNNQLLLFDNGKAERNYSRGVQYELSQDPVVVSWSYTPEPALQSLVLGSIHQLKNGHRLMNFSTAGHMLEVSESGEENWTLDAELGYGFGYTEWLRK
jgi:hypothetical protein